MLAVLLLASTAFANDVEATVHDTEPDADGTCTPVLLVWADDHVSAFEDDGQPPGIGNHRYYFHTDQPAGCTEMPGLSGSEWCGLSRVYSDGRFGWRVELDPMEEGDFGTYNLVGYDDDQLFEDTPVVPLSWSCGDCALPADIDGDGEVTIADYLDLLTAMGTSVSGDDPRDITGDGVVNGEDLVELVYSFGEACPGGL